MRDITELADDKGEGRYIMINRDTVVKRTEDIVAIDLEGKTVMMSIENGEYYGLDGAAGAIWEALEKEIKVQNIIDRLLEEFNVSEEECEKDTISFIQKLQAEKLLEVVDEKNI